LRELQRKRDLTYMFISPDLRRGRFAGEPPDRDASRKVVGEGRLRNWFKNPKPTTTRALFAAAFR